MAIDKSLYEAPQGLGALAEPDIQIEIEDPEDVQIKVGDTEIDLMPDEEEDFDENLAEVLSESALQLLSSELIADFDTDTNSRRDWLDTYVKGLDLLGLKYEERTEPWAGACGITHPLLMESAVRFQSETIVETFPSSGPVKTLIIGKETPEKKEAATRVQDDMNFRLTEEMKEYRPEHERLLFSLALAGNAFKKVYFDPALNRQVAMFIPAEDIVVPYGASSLENAERVTHKMRKTKNELRRLQVAELYRDVDLGDPVRVIDEVEKAKTKDAGLSAVTDTRFQLLEMHVDLDLEGYEDKDKNGEPTGIALPYVVTMEKGTGTVLAIRRNWLQEDPLRMRRQHFVHYGYVPGFGFYSFGLIHLIGGHTKAATSLTRQLIDAGTLSNLPGGLKSRGMRVKGDDTPIAPGEFRDVDLPSGAIRDNILMLPYKEPSATLVALMDKVVEDARRMAATADMKISDMSSQSPVGTTLAVLERMLKVLTAVQARIHNAMKQEFKLLAGIIRDNTPEEYSYEPEVGTASAKQSDYDMVDVIPVSDPNASTMSQKVVQYQAVFQLSQSAPHIYDLPYLHRQMIEVLGVKNAEKIIPMEDDMKPVDPVSENMNVITGKPVKAFMYQDHEAHIAVHMSAMQDPKLMAMIGQNPQAQSIQAAAAAHLMEHVAFQYRKEIEKQLGASLPPMPEDGEHHLPAEVEVQLSQLAAQAAARLLQKDQAEAAMQQAAQEAQDPLVAMQREELQIKQQEVQRKAMKDQMDGSYKEKDLQLKAQQMMINAALKTDELDAKDQDSEARYSMDILKQSMQHDYDNQKSDKQHVREMGKLGRQHGHERQRSATDAEKQQPEKAAPPKGDE
jgi:hypothetical protein